MKLSSLTLGLTSLLSLNSALANNLVVNGSFEQDVVSQKWTLLNNMTGWEREGAKFEIQTNRLGILTPHEGNQYIELDSTANYSVKQILDTQVNQTYTLSFYYSPRVSGNNNTNKAKVYWDGEEVANLNGTSRGWQHVSVNVTASSESTELKFSGSGTSDSYGAFIDNVSVIGIANRSCLKGLFGINSYGTSDEGYIYYFDVNTGTYSKLTGVSNTASNIASNDGVLYFMEQKDSNTKASKLWKLDLASNTETEVADTTSYPIYRSAVTPDGLSLRSTSKTYMYDFNLQTGVKTVLGKLSFEGDTFKHGDIAYSADNNILYVLTGQSLYTLDESDLSLDKIGDHGINWASGLAISESGTLYVTGRESGENAKIYSLNPATAVATFVMDAAPRVNDLTFVDDYCD